jgi:hypothetical protein
LILKKINKKTVKAYQATDKEVVPQFLKKKEEIRFLSIGKKRNKE